MTASPAPKSHQKEAMSLTNRDPNSESPGVSMDLMSLARLMARHWRVTAPAAAVTLMLVVAGRWSAAEVREALEAKDRKRCGPTAPPCGLYLVGVDY